MTDVGPLKQTPGLMTKDEAEGLIATYNSFGSALHGGPTERALLTVIALHDQINEAGKILSRGAQFERNAWNDGDGEEIPTTLLQRAATVAEVLGFETRSVIRVHNELCTTREALQRARAELTRLRALKGPQP
jgi:hypothetical protein